MKKILICGDSFSADYQKLNKNLVGWPNLLAQEYTVTNLSNAGCSQYRILRSIQTSSLTEFDGIIICHTSPYRVYIKEHPIFKNNLFYENSDLIFSDVEYHLSKKNNKILKTAKDYFECIFDDEYYREIYFLMQNEIINLTQSKPCLHLKPFDVESPVKFKHSIDLSRSYEISPNSANHYNDIDNKKIFTIIKNWIENNV
jgi:hypothetical protein